MSVTQTLRSLKKGDVVKLTMTVAVTRPNADGFHGMDFAEVGTDSYAFFTCTPDDYPSSLEIEMVKRKPREVKAGDVLPADEFRSRIWKPGTLVEHATIRNHSFVLLGNGEWVNLTDSDYAYKIEDFTSEDGYKLVYIA